MEQVVAMVQVVVVAYQVHQALRVLMEQVAAMVQVVVVAHQVHQVHRVQTGQMAHQVLMVRVEHQAHQVRQAHRVHQEQMTLTLHITLTVIKYVLDMAQILYQGIIVLFYQEVIIM